MKRPKSNGNRPLSPATTALLSLRVGGSLVLPLKQARSLSARAKWAKIEIATRRLRDAKGKLLPKVQVYRLK